MKLKKETKASIIIFCVVFIVAYIMTCFIPDEILRYSTANGSILSFLGDATVALIGMHGVLAFTFALIATLLVRIVDSEEKTKEDTKKTAKTENKKTAKKETKKNKGK